MARVSVLARVWRADGPLTPPLTPAAISQSLHSSLGVECRAAAADSSGAILLRGEVDPDVWHTVRGIRSLWVGALQLSLALEEDRISGAGVSTSASATTLLELVDAAGGTPPADAPALLLHMLNPRLAPRNLTLAHLGDVSPGRPILQLAHTDAAAAGTAASVPLDAAAKELCAASLLVRGRAVRLQAVSPSAGVARTGSAVGVGSGSGSSSSSSTSASSSAPGSLLAGSGLSAQQQQIAQLQAFLQPGGAASFGESESLGCGRRSSHRNLTVSAARSLPYQSCCCHDVNLLMSPHFYFYFRCRRRRWHLW